MHTPHPVTCLSIFFFVCVCVCVCVGQATCTGTMYLSWQRLTDCLLVALHGPRAVFAAGRRLGVGRQPPSALTQPNAAATGCPVPWRKMARTLQDTHISLATTTIRALSSNTHPPIQPPSSPRCRVNVSRRARRSPASGRPHPCPRLHHESDRGRIVSPLAGSAELLWRKLLRCLAHNDSHLGDRARACSGICTLPSARAVSCSPGGHHGHRHRHSSFRAPARGRGRVWCLVRAWRGGGRGE